MGVGIRLALGLALAGCLPGCTKLQAGRIAYTQILPAGDQLLLVGGVPKDLTGYQGLERLALLNTDGRVHHAVDERAAFSVAGVTQEVVWVSRTTNRPGLEARALDDLKPRPGITEALAAHDALAATFKVEGTHQGRAVLAGPDGKAYAVDPSATISALESGVDVTKAPRGLMLGVATPLPLVLSNNFVAGAPAQTLSRTPADGHSGWTRTLADLSAPIGVKNATVELVGTAALGGAFWLLTRASSKTRYQGDDFYEVEHKLVRIDPNSGEALESHPVVDSP